MTDPRIGIGVPTYNRPEACAATLTSITKFVDDDVDDIFVYVDGCDPEFVDAYRQLEHEFDDVAFYHAEQNKGVATAKNWLLTAMYTAGDDVLITCEDDLVITSPDAVRIYVEALQPGIEHLNFNGSTELNAKGTIGEMRAEPILLLNGVAVKALHCSVEEGWVEYEDGQRVNGVVSFHEFPLVPIYEHLDGCWSVYTRNVLERVGLMDETLVNASEHVDHTMRIVRAGLTTPFWKFADAPGAMSCLAKQDIPSVIRERPEFAGQLAHGQQTLRERWGI